MRIVMMVIAVGLADITARKSPIKVLFNVSQITLSLSLGAFVLFLRVLRLMRSPVRGWRGQARPC